MANVSDVASYILAKKGSMSAMKLQKLVYYSQAWHLVFDGDKLFDSEIQAWANGPVVRSLYREHRGLFTVSDVNFEGSGDNLAEAEKLTIDAVLDAYSEMTAGELSNLTHSEPPWLEAREGVPIGARSETPISEATMLEYYQSQLDASNVR